MYFVLVIGTLEFMRWMAYAAGCVVNALAGRAGICGVQSQGAQQIR
jgi:hypothetical protein